MTCASCVRRIEKALSRVDGVREASVNLATEKARVVFDPTTVDLPKLEAAVEKAGYKVGTVALPSPPGQAEFLAAGALYPSLGLILRPEFGALAMSASSITVVSNTLLLRREVGA